MTTPLASEPKPGDGQVPYMTALVDRLYGRLPEVYRTFDSDGSKWPLKRYLGAALHQAGLIDNVIDGIAGSNPVGPDRTPWALDGQALANWKAARTFRASSLADPAQADSKWLTWMAQLVGARLDPAANDMERRDTIRYATSGWRAGTRQAIADAAKTALTGTKYARVMPQTKPASGAGVTPGTIWQVTIVTRTSETPSAADVLAAVARKGVKPAGVVLYVTSYTSTWDIIEARYPTWDHLEQTTWDDLEQAGIRYETVPGNILVNPSFETDTVNWAAHGTNTTIARVLGGVDGVGMGRVTATAAGAAEIQQDGTITGPAITPGDHGFSVSVRPTAARAFTVTADYYSGATLLTPSQAISQGTLTANVWTRIGGTFTAPATCNKIVFWVQGQGMATAEYYDVDAAFLRRNP